MFNLCDLLPIEVLRNIFNYCDKAIIIKLLNKQLILQPFSEWIFNESILSKRIANIEKYCNYDELIKKWRKIPKAPTRLACHTDDI
jgi:hypothetical protein